MSKSNNLIGQRFGKLVVVEKASKTYNGYSVWKCICDCGREIEVDTKRLKRGTIANCGCIPKNPNLRGPIPADLTGKRYGRLTVISREKNNNSGRTCWLCKCDCGNSSVVTTHELNAGKTKSCGCLAIEKLRSRAVDLSDKKFGRLTALYPTEKRDKKGSVYWHCKCDCGNEVDITQDGLVYGSYKSCGCYKQEVNKTIHNNLTFVDNSCVEVLRSRKFRIDNTSGFRGVYAVKNGKWRAEIGLQGKTYYIGRYCSFEEAVEARLEVEKILHDGFVDSYEKWKKKARKEDEWAKNNPFYFKVEKTETSFSATTPLDRLQTINLH